MLSWKRNPSAEAHPYTCAQRAAAVMAPDLHDGPVNEADRCPPGERVALEDVGAFVGGRPAS